MVTKPKPVFEALDDGRGFDAVVKAAERQAHLLRGGYVVLIDLGEADSYITVHIERG